jgi:hypothetical protein
LPTALTCWRCENFTGRISTAGMVSGAFDENSQRPASMPVMFHSPVAVEVTSWSFCPTNCSPRKPLRLSARIFALTIGAPLVLRNEPLSRCAICACVTGADTGNQEGHNQEMICAWRQIKPRAIPDQARVPPTPHTRFRTPNCGYFR